MADLFIEGLEEELAQIDQANAGYGQYLQLLIDIADTEKQYIIRAQIKSMRRLAEIWPKYYKSTDGGIIPFVNELLNQAAELETDPPSSLRGLGISKDALQRFREERLSLIRLGLQNNIPIPPNVLAEYPSHYFDEERRKISRYDKGRVTARASRTGSEDVSLFKDFGILLRRQDGRQVTGIQRDPVKAGLEEIFELVGDLSEIFRATKLTIIHTAGKHIYCDQDAFGSYNVIYRSITIGAKDEFGEPSVNSLGHELLGHWLDYASVPLQPDLESMIQRPFPVFRHNMNISLLDAYNQSHDSIICKAVNTMSPIDPKEQHALLICPSEIYGRMAEQYLSILLYQKGMRNLVCCQPPDYFYMSQGYWNRDQWTNELGKDAEIQLATRLELAKRVNQGFVKEAVSSNVTQTFPWIKK
jgi:hypothetical protein